MLSLKEAAKFRQIFKDADVPKALLLTLKEKSALPVADLTESAIRLVALFATKDIVTVKQDVLSGEKVMYVLLSRTGRELVEYFQTEWVDELQAVDETEGDRDPLTKHEEQKQLDKQVNYFIENTLKKEKGTRNAENSQEG